MNEWAAHFSSVPNDALLEMIQYLDNPSILKLSLVNQRTQLALQEYLKDVKIFYLEFKEILGQFQFKESYNEAYRHIVNFNNQVICGKVSFNPTNSQLICKDKSNPTSIQKNRLDDFEIQLKFRSFFHKCFQEDNPGIDWLTLMTNNINCHAHFRFYYEKVDLNVNFFRGSSYTNEKIVRAVFAANLFFEKKTEKLESLNSECIIN